jgi:competence protein ComEC
MLLGDASGISAFIFQDMVRTGTVHVLVVSGTNVGLVVFVCHILLKLLRIPRRPRFFFLFPAIVLYCLITGASPPVIRAGIMASVFVSAYLFQREADIINSCCLAVLAMLAWDPRQLFDVSFQLSFASVLAIILLFPRLKKLFRADAIKQKFLGYICDSCLVSASAWLGTGFLLAWYFQMVSPVSILANLFIVPLAGLITLSGACLVISSWLAPCITRFCAISCDHAVFLMVLLNSWFANLPWAYFSWKQPC